MFRSGFNERHPKSILAGIASIVFLLTLISTALSQAPSQSMWPTQVTGPVEQTALLRRLPPIEPPETASTEPAEPIPAPAVENRVKHEVETVESDILLDEKLLDVEPPAWYRPYFDPWKGNVELGLNGTSGASETISFRAGFESKLELPKYSIGLDLDYQKTNSDGVEQANRLFFEWDFDRKKVAGPFDWFINGTVIYDEFQPWNTQVSASTGLSYDLVTNEIVTLKGRWGSGFSQDYGGPDDEARPEMHWGIDYRWQMSRRHKIKLSSDYFPNVTNFGDYRMVSKGSWEILLDEVNNLSMKINATDRFNRPNPGGNLNDIDYSIVLLWQF